MRTAGHHRPPPTDRRDPPRVRRSARRWLPTPSGRSRSTTTPPTCTGWPCCRPSADAAPADLVAYALDFKYEQIQKDLFLHVLPFCLRAWHEDLTSPFGRYETFVDEFYPALLRGSVFDGVLAPQEADGGRRLHARRDPGADRRAAAPVVQGSKCAASTPGSTRCRPTACLRPDIAALWSAWWAVETPGRALAAAQYASCLIYDETANPVFDAWTREHGGGPPCLWHYRGHVLEERWRDANLEMLERTLTPDGVRAVLDRSVARLAATRCATRSRRSASTWTRAPRRWRKRCADVRRFLATPNEAEYSFQWTP